MTKKVEQETIFSMFDITDEVEEKRKKEEEERQKRIEEMKKKADESKNSTDTPKKKEENTFTINKDTQFYHLGEHISVLEFVSEDEINNGITRKKKGEEVVEPLTGEDFRKRAEKEYPDLVKEYTELVYVKKKNLVLAVSKAKKKGLYSECPSGHSPSLPKIDFDILQSFINFAWKVYVDKGTECHADIYFDYDSRSYFLDKPTQAANRVNVEVTEDALSMAERLADKRFLKVMEIHSHHSMAARPSVTDDQSERGPYLYAIVGNMYSFFPEITVRYFDESIDAHVTIGASQVFADPFKTENEEDHSMVEVVDVV